MGSNWTDKQLEAINADNTSVIVSAAAGSGKTSVLVERLLRQLSDTQNKIPADRIVVVTFTNDAAAQMKQRLSARLSAQIEKEPDNMWLYEQQSLIQSAKISTIHSFCFDLIRDNIQLLDISAGFRILDDTEEKIILTKAMSEVMEKFCKKEKKTISLLTDFFCGSKRDDYPLQSIILSVHKFIMSIPFFEDWLKKNTKHFENDFCPENDIWANDYIKMLNSQYKGLAQSAKRCLSMCEQIGADKAYALIDNEYETFMALADGTLDSSLEWDDRIYSKKADFDRIAFPKSEAGSFEKQIAEQIKEIRNKYKDQTKKLIDEGLFSFEDIIDDYRKHKDIVGGLTKIVLALCDEIAKIKTERNALGFSDAEQLAVKLLAQKDDNGNIVKTRLAKDLSEYYKVIMIDEYQDSNNTQDLIFKLLSHNGTSSQAGDNLFVVGDVKQSIYRFRLANPQIFIDALKKADKYYDGYDGKNSYILLNRNFRSSKDVIWFVNYVFSQIMSVDVGDIKYTDDEMLVQGATFDDDDRTTEVIIIPDDDNAEDNSDNEYDEENEQTETSGIVCESNEAKAVAQKINSMLYKRELVDKGIKRPCEPKDFCILLRDRGRSSFYIAELEKYGIKACAEETDGYLNSREISVLINLLTVTDNPMLDIPLASVLMSPMFMITADEIAKIRLVSEDRKEPLYKAVLTVTNENADDKYKSESYYTKLLNFLSVLEKLRYCSASQGLERLIRTAYDSTDFLSVVQLFKDGEQKKANLRLLLEYAKSYEKNSKGGLSGFINYIRNIFEQGGDLKKAGIVSSSDNVVSIKTIHKSKGLEFPYVFLCGTSKQFNMQDLNSRMQINSDYGMGFKIQDIKTLRFYNSFPHTIIKMHNKQNSVSEEMRLLYVALTRAKEQLFITITDNKKTRTFARNCASVLESEGRVTTSLSASAQSMQDWLVMALLRHPDCKALRELCDNSTSAVDEDNHIRESVFSPEEVVTGVKEEKKAVPNSDMVKSLENYFSYKYDDRLALLPAKLTVTEIVREEHENEITLRKPQFSSDNKKLSASEAGTAMHTFMQYADFKNAESNALDEIARLCENGVITEQQALSLNDNIGKIKTFFDGKFYERMKNSTDLRREFKFLIEISRLSLDDSLGSVYNNTDGMLQGIADCIFEENGHLVLVDYKTDGIHNENAFAERYKLQLSLYSKALSLIFNKPVSQSYIYSFSLGKEINIL